MSLSKLLPKAKFMIFAAVKGNENLYYYKKINLYQKTDMFIAKK